VDASDWGVNAGIAAGLTGALSAGAVVKGWVHSLDDSSVGEGAVDLGGTYEAMPGTLRLGAVVQNVGYAGKMAGHRPPLPIALKGGAAWTFRAVTEPMPIEGAPPSWNPAVRVTVAGDVTAYQKGEPVDVGMGLEAELNGILLGRVGYLRAVKDTGDGAGLGFGLGLRVFGMRLDYAFVSVGDLGRGQFATLSWESGPRGGPRKPAATPSSAAPVKASSAQAAPVPDPDREYADASALYAAGDYAGTREKLEPMLATTPAHWQGWQLLGNARFGLGDRAGALEAYAKSLELNPDNGELKKWMETLAGSSP
jgi:hypothetical protein